MLQGKWETQEQQHHIIQLEMSAVAKALLGFSLPLDTMVIVSSIIV